MSSRRLGLIGIGLLGRAIAERLRAGDFDVVGFDHDPSAAAGLAAIGGRAVQNAAEVAAEASRIVFCLPDHAVVRSVLTGMSDALVSGHVLIDTTTGDHASAEEFARELEPRGITYIEATISGSSDHVRYGDALVMTGGDRGACEACRDVLATIARQILHAGSVGSAAKLKLATNLVLGLNRAALVEGLAFAEALGLDAALALQALRAGLAYSRIMDSKGPKLLAGDFTPQAKLSQHEKDVRLMLAAAETAGLTLPLSVTHNQLLREAIAAGWGDLDNCALYRLYAAQRRSVLPENTASVHHKMPAPDSWAAQ